VTSRGSCKDLRRATRRHIPGEDILHSHRCENLKSYIPGKLYKDQQAHVLKGIQQMIMQCWNRMRSHGHIMERDSLKQGGNATCATRKLLHHSITLAFEQMPCVIYEYSLLPTTAGPTTGNSIATEVHFRMIFNSYVEHRALYTTSLYLTLSLQTHAHALSLQSYF
jgi:hypothetical protein